MVTKNLNSEIKGQDNLELKSMSFFSSIIYFGIPAILMIIGFYVVMPGLIKRGLPPFNAFKKEENVFTLSNLKERFRLKHLNWKM